VSEAGLLDTSVVLALGQIATEELPRQGAIAALTLAELAAGPAATADPHQRAERQARLQTAEAAFDVLPFDAACARAWPRVYAATMTSSRKPRGRGAVDLMIATTALANGLPFYTANPDDVVHLAELIAVRGVTLNV
jgi:predicted nucleic acid-binding protein